MKINEVLQELKKNFGRYVSGGSLSRGMGISRTAVWKEIERLREKGYMITSSSRKGYKLDESPDVVTADELKVIFAGGSGDINNNANGKRWKVVSLDSIDSTNSYAKKFAAEDKDSEDKILVIAEEQTAGRGRLGREWVSQKGSGIWMSIILRPSLVPEDAQMITMVAGLSAAQAITKVSGLDCGIKWPNDIIIKSKKVSGILTEIHAELERIHFLVVGIGINVNQSTEDFPPELRDVAVSLKQLLPPEINIRRAQLVKEFLDAFDKNYGIFIEEKSKGDCSEFVKEYSKFSVTIGREVKIIQGDIQYTALAQNITEDGKLIVKCDNGEVREIYSGEVSVRGLLGYTE